MRAAARVEALKLFRSRVGLIGTLVLMVGTLALLAAITAAVAGGNPQLIMKAGPAAQLDWTGLLAGAAQITSAGGLLGFGVVLSWMVGREFADGTIAGLFTLSVSRARIAAAKLVVYLLWAAALAVILIVGLIALGLLLGYGPPDDATVGALGRQALLTVLTALAATPVAWLTTLARSLLAGVAGAIAVVIIAQIGALAGAGGWLPLAAPALWAISNGTAVTPLQLGLTAILAVASGTLACTTWARLQLDR